MNKAEEWKQRFLNAKEAGQDAGDVYEDMAQEREDLLFLSSGEYAHSFADGSILVETNHGDGAYENMMAYRSALARSNEEKAKQLQGAGIRKPATT